MTKILIAPNSFKECENSVRTSELLEEYLMKEFKMNSEKIEIIKKPISDGGDGFLEVCKNLFNAKSIFYTISDVLDSQKISCEVAYSEELKTIYIESAKVLGLQTIPKEKRDILHSNSCGMGQLILQIQNDVDSKKYNVEKIIIGIGGTATSDLGIGAASMFDLKIFDKEKYPLKTFPINFEKIIFVDYGFPKLPFGFEIVIDVNNPIIGEKGAAKIFAKQKGASDDEIETLENGARNFLKIFHDKYHLNDIKDLSGAGGGLAGGFQLFFDAKKIFAKDFIQQGIGISKKENYDLVITGEGSFDEQTFSDKGIQYLLDEFRETVPIFVIAGKINFNKRPIENHFENVYFIELSKFFYNENDSIKYFEKAIEFASNEIIKIIKERNLLGAK